MKCTNCNSKIPKNTKFCPNCGAEISQTDMINNDTVANESTRKTMTTKNKVLIILSGCILILGIFLLIAFFNNFFCIFGHDTIHKTIEPTCTLRGHSEVSCKYCNFHNRYDETESLGHNIESGECGEDAICSVCGQEVNNHQTKNYNSTECMHCGKSKYSLNLPNVPLIVNTYNSKGLISSSYKITEITTRKYSGVEIFFTIEKIYDEAGNNYSTTPRLAYKIYSSDNQVIDSGNILGDATISVGEKTKADITAFIDEWKDYKLVIINVQE